MTKTTETALPEVLADKPKGPSREQTTKMLLSKYPGHISWASDRANFSGCRVVSFYSGTVNGLDPDDETLFRRQHSEAFTAQGAYRSPEATMNLYFSTRANLLVVDMKPTFDDGIGIMCLVTTQLDEEDLEELQESQQFLEVHMRQWREARAERKTRDAANVAEIHRLAAIGKKAEEHNLFEKLRKLEEK